MITDVKVRDGELLISEVRVTSMPLDSAKAQKFLSRLSNTASSDALGRMSNTRTDSVEEEIEEVNQWLISKLKGSRRPHRRRGLKGAATRKINEIRIRAAEANAMALTS